MSYPEQEEAVITYRREFFSLWQGNLGSVEHSSIAITPRSTLARTGSTGYGPIYGSNRTVWKLFVFKRTNKNTQKTSFETSAQNLNMKPQCLKMHGTHVTALLFLLIQYMYKYKGCHNIHGTHVTALLFLLTQNMYKYIGCLNIHGTQVTAQLFLLPQNMYKYIGCLNIHGLCIKKETINCFKTVWNETWFLVPGKSLKIVVIHPLRNIKVLEQMRKKVLEKLLWDRCQSL